MVFDKEIKLLILPQKILKNISNAEVKYLGYIDIYDEKSSMIMNFHTL